MERTMFSRELNLEAVNFGEGAGSFNCASVVSS